MGSSCSSTGDAKEERVSWSSAESIFAIFTVHDNTSRIFSVEDGYIPAAAGRHLHSASAGNPKAFYRISPGGELELANLNPLRIPFGCHSAFGSSVIESCVQ
jgi:hypothetical protein